MNCRFHTSMAFIAVLLAGCGGSKDSGGNLRPSGPSLPPCANVGQAVSLPSDFPNSFPLPPGAVVNSSQRSATGTTTISAVIPMAFKEAAAFFQSKLPAAGYKLLEGDAEMDEAESTFAGNGFQGKWKVNGILNCPRAVRLTIALAKTQIPGNTQN